MSENGKEKPPTVDMLVAGQEERDRLIKRIRWFIKLLFTQFYDVEVSRW